VKPLAALVPHQALSPLERELADPGDLHGDLLAGRPPSSVPYQCSSRLSGSDALLTVLSPAHLSLG
jgi:hypothetical protein